MAVDGCISLYKNRGWAFFAISHLFPDIVYLYIFRHIFWPWKYRSRHVLQYFSGAIEWQMQDLLYDGNSIVCSVSHRLRYILKTRKILNLWPWKWRRRSRSRRTGLALFDWKCSTFEFFWILLTWTYIYKKM